MSLAIYVVAGLLQAAPTNAPTVQSRLDHLAAAAAVCEVSGAYFTQFTDERRLVRVLIPKAIWLKRKQPEVAVKLGCLRAVVTGQGHKPILLGMRR